MVTHSMSRLIQVFELGNADGYDNTQLLGSGHPGSHLKRAQYVATSGLKF